MPLMYKDEHACIVSEDFYLEHYGIKGMKWGERRYQYPDGRLTPEGKIRYSTGNKKTGMVVEFKPPTEYDIGKGMKEIGKTITSIISTSDSVSPDPVSTVIAPIHETIINTVTPRVLPLASQALGYGAAGSAAGVAIYWGVKLSTAAHGTLMESKYAKERHEAPTDGKTGLKKKTNKNMTEKDDAKRINADHANLSQDNKHNCLNCGIAYDMRRRGYDVAAGRTTKAMPRKTVKEVYPDAKLKLTDKPFKESMDILKDQGNGSRGLLFFDWKGMNGLAGHTISYEVKNGEVQLIDGQTGKVFKENSPQFLKISLLAASEGIQYTRLDNLNFNPETVKEHIR